MAARQARPVPQQSTGGGRLAVTGRAVTKKTTLTIPQGMSIGAWRNLGRQIFVISDSSSWWLGDWLIYGQSEYPDRYRHAIAETSLDYQTLRNYAWVARRFAPHRRRDRLSFQHHAEVARMPEPEQDRWLTQAEVHGWSRNELRQRIQDQRNLKQRTRQVVHIQMNLVADQKQRWQEAAERAEKDLLAWMVTVLDNAASSMIGPGGGESPGAAEISTTEHRAAEISTAEISVTEHHAAEISTADDSAAEIGALPLPSGAAAR